MTTNRLLRYVAILVFGITSLVHAGVLLPLLAPIASDGTISAISLIAGGDFPAFYVAGAMTWEDAVVDIWHPANFAARLAQEFGDGVADLQFISPPTALLLWSPLGALAFLPSFWLWTAIPGLALALCVYRVSRSSLATALTIASPLVIYNAGAGQTGVFFAVALTVFATNIASHPKTAGCAGALFVIKPHIALALPFCVLAKRDWRGLSFMAISTLALVGASVQFFGISSWFEFLAAVQIHASGVFSSGAIIFDRSPSLYLGLLNLGLPHGLAWAGYLVTALTALTVCMRVWNRSEDICHRLFALALTVCLLTPKIMHYDAVVLVVPIAILIAELERGKLDKLLTPFAMFIWCMPLLVPVFNVMGVHPGGFIFLAALIAVHYRVANPSITDMKP